MEANAHTGPTTYHEDHDGRVTRIVVARSYGGGQLVPLRSVLDRQRVAPSSTTRLRGPRRRGAGRPAGHRRTARTSVGGDDSGPGEPEPALAGTRAGGAS